jgi:choline dehydrogenase-like flavoprotein
MLIDLAQHRPDFTATTFDACIIGGGVAGITLAIKLGRAGRSVLLVEAGDQGVSAKSQSYYRGDIGDLENLPLHETRIRALGGSSHHWGGWCLALDPYDLARTDLLPDGAWPIEAPDVDPYFREAATILGITEFSSVDDDLADADGNLHAIRAYFSKPPANLGAKYVDELRQSTNITLVLNAAYLSAALDTNNATVDSIALHDQRSRSPLICKARQFVFAMGAIENVRHLLILNQRNSTRVLDIGKNLGRYYMQHLHQELGQFVILRDAAPAFAKSVRSTFIAATEKYLRHRGHGAFRLYSTRLTDCADLIDRFRNVVTGASCHGAASAGTVSITCEQVPRAESRVLLNGKDDELGQPRIRLDWCISDDDRVTMREAALEFGRYLIHAEIGRLNVNPVVLSSAHPLQGWTALGPAPGAAGHQMGGARMSSGAEDGVVDRDCRVWGLNNLYVAGSAVFRTCGHATPTLTITQLALRLADTLNRTLAR